MKHIQILFLIINLIIGALVMIYTGSINRKSVSPVLKNLVFYLLSFNFFIFIDFNYKYTFYNIWGSDFVSYPESLALILYLLVSAAEAGFIFFLQRTADSLKNLPASKYFLNFFKVLVSLYVIATAGGSAAYIIDAEYKWLYFVHMIWIFSVILIIFSVLTGVFIYSRRVNEKDIKKQLSSFALIFSSGFILFALANFGFYFFNLNSENFDPLIFAIINISPFVWLRFYWNKGSMVQQDTGITTSYSFPNVVADFNISARESEIIRLIIEGKSNKEIEVILSISFNTVKNHIYNIYRKLGVNSRSQLIRFINECR
jgi:DNA-binding CsgD family transcriptional regulator